MFTCWLQLPSRFLTKLCLHTTIICLYPSTSRTRRLSCTLISGQDLLPGLFCHLYVAWFGLAQKLVQFCSVPFFFCFVHFFLILNRSFVCNLWIVIPFTSPPRDQHRHQPARISPYILFFHYCVAYASCAPVVTHTTLAVREDDTAIPPVIGHLFSSPIHRTYIHSVISCSHRSPPSART